MSEALTSRKPEFRNINIFKDVTTYRLPPAAWVSILHRVSGLLLILALPFILWLFEKSVTSEIAFGQFKALFNAGALGLPGWIFKIIGVILVWAYLHHFCAGVRHIYMDLTHATTKEFGKNSALTTLVVSLVLTAAAAAKIFGAW